MNHDELAEYLELELASDFEFTPDQADVMYAFQEGTGRVCVGSSAGTGKTTTLTRVVAESVARMTTPEPDTIETNPFDEILVTTFTVDAAGQLKTKIKQLLRTHEEASQDAFDPALWRWLETDNNIATIDSFIGDLLRKISPEVGVAPGYDIRDEIETQEILRDVIRTLEDEDEDEYTEALEILDNVLADKTPREFLFSIHQKLREACHGFADPDADSGTTMFADLMRDELYNAREPPFSDADIRNIVSNVTGMAESNIDVPNADDRRRRMEDDYQYSIAFAQAVDDLIDAFEAEYDKITRETGKLSHQDIIYIVWEYLEQGDSQEFRTSLANRFSKIFIDEFQDTSYAQCQILRHLIDNKKDGADVLIIGDIKQSIYEWRSADPEIFARILEHADEDTAEPDPYLGAREWIRTELVTNFRSHPHLVRAGNHLFNRIFTNEGMGAIGTFPIDFQPMRPHRPPTNDEMAHLHVLPLGDAKAEEWRTRDPQETAATIHGLIENDEVTVGDGSDERPVRAGDITLLFRRGTHMQSFRDALDEHGIDNAVIAEQGLFKTDEIGFIVDVLDWFANPHSKDSLLRILRSPVTALSDRTLRYLASHDWNLPHALDEWPPDDLPQGDRERLNGLIDLRSDLRWDREGSKATLVQKIIQHTGLETILLAGDDALQRYGNLWMLVELTRDWEDEDLLPYREFVDRLKQYRRMARSRNETFEVAQTADSSDEGTVKLRTVHSSKGLEFDVVVLPDLLAGPGGRVQNRDRAYFRDQATGERRLALRPRPAGDPVEFSDGPGATWVREGYRSTLWLAPDRDSKGQFKYDHPYNASVQDDFAEFWRLLYVAFTRASDHLLLPLGDSISHNHHWSSWAHPSLDVFQTGASWSIPEDGEPKPFELDHTAMDTADSPPDSIPFDVGLLEQTEPTDTGSLGLPSMKSVATSVESKTAWEEIPFAPRELKPSTLHDIIACPRRYQYRALQKVSEVRGESPPGTASPEGYSPNYWGTLVHKSLEAIHEDISSGTETDEFETYQTFVEQNEEIREELTSVIESYQESSLWERVKDAKMVLPEYELSALHPTEPQVHLNGVADLVIETDDGWEVIDFKTGTEPTTDSYVARQYHWQLATYTWLIKQEYNIDVSRTGLYYIESGGFSEKSVDSEKFASFLRELPSKLEIEPESGLSVRPKPDPDSANEDDLKPTSRCGSCPYTSICPAWNGG